MVSGTCTCPPFSRASNSRSASASSEARERQGNPLEVRPPLAMAVRSHHGRIADPQARVHHLVRSAGWNVGRLGTLLEAQQERHFGAERAAVELHRLLGAAIEEQVGLDLHGVPPRGWFVIIAGERSSSAPRRLASLSDCARSRSSCCRSSDVSSGPKSSASNTWRISISDSPSIGLGQRLAHSIASSSDAASISQKPAITSFQGKGRRPRSACCPRTHARTFRARVQPFAREQRTGLRQLLVVLAHGGEKLFPRHDAGFGVPIRPDHHHESHRLASFLVSDLKPPVRCSCGLTCRSTGRTDEVRAATRRTIFVSGGAGPPCHAPPV